MNSVGINKFYDAVITLTNKFDKPESIRVSRYLLFIKFLYFRNILNDTSDMQSMNNRSSNRSDESNISDVSGIVISAASDSKNEIDSKDDDKDMCVPNITEIIVRLHGIPVVIVKNIILSAHEIDPVLTGMEKWEEELWTVYALNYFGVKTDADDLLDIDIPPKGIPLLREVLGQYSCCKQFKEDNKPLWQYIEAYFMFSDLSLLPEFIGNPLRNNKYVLDIFDSKIGIKNMVNNNVTLIDRFESVDVFYPNRIITNILVLAYDKTILVFRDGCWWDAAKIFPIDKNKIYTSVSEMLVIGYSGTSMIIINTITKEQFSFEAEEQICNVVVSSDDKYLGVTIKGDDDKYYFRYYKLIFRDYSVVRGVYSGIFDSFTLQVYCHCSDRILFVFPTIGIANYWEINRRNSGAIKKFSIEKYSMNECKIVLSQDDSLLCIYTVDTLHIYDADTFELIVDDYFEVGIKVVGFIGDNIVVVYREDQLIEEIVI